MTIYVSGIVDADAVFVMTGDGPRDGVAETFLTVRPGGSFDGVTYGRLRQVAGQGAVDTNDLREVV